MATAKKTQIVITANAAVAKNHETKKSLADALLEGSDVSSRLSRDEILALLAA